MYVYILQGDEKTTLQGIIINTLSHYKFFFNLSKQLYSFKKGRGHNDIRKQVFSPVPECEFFGTMWLNKKKYRALYQKFSHLLTKRNMIMKKFTKIDL